MSNSALSKSALTIWISPRDHELLAELLDELLGALHRGSRHLAGLAAVRAGLRLLCDHPELVPDLLSDQPQAKHVRVRNQ